MKKKGLNIERNKGWRDECIRWIYGFANAGGGWMMIDIKINEYER